MNIFYNPPYDSPIEDLFALSFSKYLNPEIQFVPQFKISTICGTFRMDFIIKYSKNIIAIECDGKEFHNSGRDEWRDAMILGSSKIDEIYRFKGADITYHIDDVLNFIMKDHPHLFSDRGISCLKQLSSDENRYYVDINRTLRNKEGVKRQFWKGIFEYAEKIGGGDLDDVIAKWKSEHFEQVA